MKHFFRIDKEKEQIVLIEKNGKYDDEFKKPESPSDIWFNLSNITNRSGNLETKLYGDAIMNSYAFRIKNFGDKDYAYEPKAHFQFKVANEDINANHYYITNILHKYTQIYVKINSPSRESNSRPFAYKANALPLSYWGK